jgi:hypothetical protein
LHPDVERPTRIDGELKHETPTETVVRVDGSEARTCTGENPCTINIGPFPGAAHQVVALEVTAKTSNGEVYKDQVQWPLIRCTGQPGFVPPTQIPDSGATQTAPNLYQLTDSRVMDAAQQALLEYANFLGVPLEDIDTGDEMVAAVAQYVDAHMTWKSDADHNPHCLNTVHGLGYAPGWDFPIPANYTIRYTGSPGCNCPTDYCGDCEDHAILRAALLRALGFRAECIWNVINDPVTHEYNMVVYEGAFRLMDYGPIASWANVTYFDAAHRSFYGYNEAFGPRGVGSANHDFLATNAFNYRLHRDLQSDARLKKKLECQRSPIHWTYYKWRCP